MCQPSKGIWHRSAGERCRKRIEQKPTEEKLCSFIPKGICHPIYSEKEQYRHDWEELSIPRNAVSHIGISLEEKEPGGIVGEVVARDGGSWVVG